MSIKMKTPLLKERQTSLDASRKKAGRTWRPSPILPFPGLNTPAKVLKPPLSVFRVSLLYEMAIRLFFHPHFDFYNNEKIHFSCEIDQRGN